MRELLSILIIVLFPGTAAAETDPEVVDTPVKMKMTAGVPDHLSQQPLFHKPLQNQGIYLTIEVHDADKP